jgi:L-ascorbate 6-phosphate lactonase
MEKVSQDDKKGIMHTDDVSYDRPIDRTTWAVEVAATWGTYLNRQVKNERVKPGSVVLWWLGGASFFMKTPESTILIDNYSGPSLYTTYEECGVCHRTGAESMDWVRLNPQIIDPFAVEVCDAHFSSHHHGDHCDIYTVKALLANTDAKFVGPAVTAGKLRRLGVPEDHVIQVKPGDLIKINDVEAIVTETYDTGAQITGKDYSKLPYPMDEVAVAYIFQTPGGNIFHGGDTLYADRYAAIGAKNKVDVAILPMGQNGPGLTDKMSPHDVFRIAQALKARVVIPMHYDNWTIAQLDPSQLEDIVRRSDSSLKSVILQWGARFEYPADENIGRYVYPDLSDRYDWNRAWRFPPRGPEDIPKGI